MTYRLLGVMTVLALALPTLAEHDGTTPKAAYRSYITALGAGNFDDLKAASMTTPGHVKMLEGLLGYMKSDKAFREAVIKAYPVAAKRLPDPTKETLNSLDNAETKIDGESATLLTKQSGEPVKLKKDGTKWKVDLVSMYPAESLDDVMTFHKAMAGVMDDMLPDVEARKYKDFDDVTSTLEMRVKMRLAMPPSEEATTKPGE